jgi:hypothetical protein
MTVDSPKPQCAMHDFRFQCMISGFCYEVTGNGALLSYYAVSSGNFLPTFRDNMLVPSSGFMNQKFLNPGDGTNSLSQNVGKKLPLLAA